MIGAIVFNRQATRLKKMLFRPNAGLGPKRRDGGMSDVAELPDDLLDHVAGGGDQPTNTAQQTGSPKSASTLNNT